MTHIPDKALRQHTAVPGAAKPAPSPVAASNGHVDEESLYQRFKNRLLSEVSLGSASITVTPPEKLRKDFQQAEAARVVELVRGLRPLGKRVLKLLEAIEGKPLSQREINVRLGRSESSNRDMGEAVKELSSFGLVTSNSHGVLTTIRKKIASDLSTYQPTDDEIEATYQAALFEIATEQ